MVEKLTEQEEQKLKREGFIEGIKAERFFYQGLNRLISGMESIERIPGDVKRVFLNNAEKPLQFTLASAKYYYNAYIDELKKYHTDPESPSTELNNLNERYKEFIKIYRGLRKYVQLSKLKEKSDLLRS